MKTKTYPPTPATSAITPEMIDQYRQLLSLRHEKADWLRGYYGNELRVCTAGHLFIIRFEDGYVYVSESAAYLSVASYNLGRHKRLNEIFWPYFEIRRYRNGNTGPGGVLPMLSVHDWTGWNVYMAAKPWMTGLSGLPKRRNLLSQRMEREISFTRTTNCLDYEYTETILGMDTGSKPFFGNRGTGYRCPHRLLRAYDDLLFDEALADIYYVDNQVDCLPCDKAETDEWYYVEPPLDTHSRKEMIISFDKIERR